MVHLLLRVIMDGDGMGASLPGNNEPLLAIDIVMVKELAGRHVLSLVRSL